MKKKINLDMAAAEWLSIKDSIRHLEKRLGELKIVLEEALRASAQKTFELRGWRFSLVEFAKRSFNLSKAEAKIDGRVLAPYITETPVIQIRTSFQGGEEEKEAA